MDNNYDIVKAFNNAVNHIEQKRVPFVIWSKGPFIPWFSGVNIKNYYTNRKAALKAQIELQSEYSEALLWPGIWPDLGPIVEASALGGKVTYFEDKSPFVAPGLKDIKEYKKLKLPDVNSNDLMHELLKGWEYLWENLDPTYVEHYGYLDGCASIFGPFEIACQVVGYEKLFISMYEEPEIVKGFLDFISNMLLKLLEAHEKINGSLKRISITDHAAALISKEHFKEFYVPYLRKVCDAYPEAIKLYHNEGDIYHVLELIPDLGTEIFHFGIEIADVKEAIGSEICLMGAVHSRDYLLNKSPQEVYEEAKRQIKIGGPGGGYLLSSGGGFQYGIPKKNLDAMAKAAKDVEIK